MRDKLSVAVVKMTGCAGCQMEFLRLEEEFMELLERVSIEYFVMAKRENYPGPYDIAFVEGSISTPRELEELRELRRQAETLVAFGDCASTGCIPSILNWVPPVASSRVYEDFTAIHSRKESFQRIIPLSEFVDVDVHLRGCPPHKDTILEVLKAGLLGMKPWLRLHPVCVECKLKENNCLLTSERRPCMGPVTAAGCGAICPSVGRICEGCYGPMSDANAESLAKIFMEECSISKEDVVRKIRKYAGVTRPFLKEAGGV
ncbi:MAG: oxidoreductase [Candidatus Bathyarchaeia archaeon]